MNLPILQFLNDKIQKLLYEVEMIICYGLECENIVHGHIPRYLSKCQICILILNLLAKG